MEEAMLEDEGYGISIYSLAQNNTSFASAINTALRGSVNAEADIYPRGSSPETGIDALRTNTSWDANTYLKEKIVYDEISHLPVIYFVKKPESCFTLSSPVVVIATDADDCDDVAGWRGSTEVLISEAEAASTSEVIIFVGPGRASSGGTTLLVGNNESIESAYEGAIVERVDANIDVDNFQIKKRWETSKHSEIMGFRVRWNTGDEHIVKWNDFDPKDVHKNDIPNTLFTGDQDAFKYDITTSPTGQNSIFFGTFEYDWYASAKLILNDCSSDPDNSLGAKMKYEGEVYFKGCGVGNTLFPSVNSTFNVNNTNCRFDLKRVM